MLRLLDCSGIGLPRRFAGLLRCAWRGSASALRSLFGQGLVGLPLLLALLVGQLLGLLEVEPGLRRALAGSAAPIRSCALHALSFARPASWGSAPPGRAIWACAARRSTTSRRFSGASADVAAASARPRPDRGVRVRWTGSGLGCAAATAANAIAPRPAAGAASATPPQRRGGDGARVRSLHRVRRLQELGEARVAVGCGGRSSVRRAASISAAARTC